MKNTGIVRKIDELGRIVIPKEIRNVLNRHSNDDLEIFIDNANIVLKKYEKSGLIKDFANKLTVIVESYANVKMFVTNKEHFITDGELLNEKLDNNLLNFIEERKKYESNNVDLINGLKGYFLIYPIIIDSDIVGLLIFYKETSFSSEEKIIGNVVTKIIENK